MKFKLIKELLPIIEEFEQAQKQQGKYKGNIEGFKQWVVDTSSNSLELTPGTEAVNWEGKEKGRSTASAISTLLVHMSRYAKTYSKSAMVGSDFSSQDDFIFLINLKAFGALSKMELIRKNKHDKPGGMQIINRLVKQGWVEQSDSDADKRSKVIKITEKGLVALEAQMDKIRKASEIVTGNLSEPEKLELIRLLNKLDSYHQEIYDQQIDSAQLIEKVMANRLKENELI